nr:replicative DNA helicase [bacterium]
MDEGTQGHTNINSTPPQAPDIEEIILGTIIMDPQTGLTVLGILTHEDFYVPDHRKVFKVLEKMLMEGDTIDAVTVDERVKGVREYLVPDLLRGSGGSHNIEAYCNIVKDKSRKRKLIQVARNIEKTSFADDKPADEILGWAQQAVFNIMEYNQGRVHDIADVMQQVLDKISKLQNEDVEIGIPTGLDVDQLITGFEPAKYYVIGGRPSMGKTALVLSMMNYQGAKGKRSAIISLETSAESIGFRLLTLESGVDTYTLKHGMTESEKIRVLDCASKLSQRGIIVDDTLEMDDHKLRAKILQLVRDYKIDILYIDFLQLMTATAGTRELEIAKISRAIKVGCKEANIPIVALAQLSRAVEMRGDKRPQMSDLRESGTIEQDADVIMFLYRPEYYGETNYPDGSSTENICEIIVAKNKDGDVGIKKHLFVKEKMRFQNLAQPTTGGQFDNKAPF